MSTSIYLIPPPQPNSNPQASFTYIKSLIENSSIAKYTSISQLTSYITYNNSTIYELEFSSIPTFDFIEKIRSISPKVKMVPSNQIRSLIIKGVNKIIPLIDLFTVLLKVTSGVKRVTRAHCPNVPGVGQGMYQVDYSSHENAMEALVTINSKKKLSCIKGSIEAFVAEPLIDNLKKIMDQECSVIGFENVNANVVDVFEFKEFIEKVLSEKKEENIKIKKIRQYFSKIFVEFSQSPKCFDEYINKENSYLLYNGKNIIVKKMMKPCTNIGKYKERSIKLSTYAISDEDKNNLIMKLENKQKYLNEEQNLRRKADALYNRILQDEKRELEKEREREEYSNRHNKKRERDHSDRKRYSSHEEHSRRRNEDNTRYEKSSSNHNHSHSNNNQPQNNGIDLNQLSSLLQQGNPLSQLFQLLSNPNININQLLSQANNNDNMNQLQNLNMNQQNKPNQSISNQLPGNLLQIPNLQFQNQPNLSSLLSNPSMLALLHNQEQNQQTQINSSIIPNQPNAMNAQPNPQMGQSQQQNINTFNPMMNIPKIIPPPMDIHQPFYMPPTGKGFYPQGTNPQQFPYPMGDMFMNSYQIDQNQNNNQNKQ